MYFLALDTETTGLPPKEQLNSKNYERWCRLIELSYALFDYSGQCLTSYHVLIKPNGFTIPSEATCIHGISTAEAIQQGVSIEMALEYFTIALERADYLIAHNIKFDMDVLQSEYFRTGSQSLFYSEKKLFCTAEMSKTYQRKHLKIKNPRFLSLSTMYDLLFNKKIQYPHRALSDTHACAEIFFNLQRKIQA